MKIPVRRGDQKWLRTFMENFLDDLLLELALLGDRGAVLPVARGLEWLA